MMAGVSIDHRPRRMWIPACPGMTRRWSATGLSFSPGGEGGPAGPDEGA